jgi:subfamily B ATP-binding cassette protein MsbA
MINRGVLARRLFPLGTRGANGPLARIAANYVRLLPVVALLGLLASVLEGIGIGLLIPLLALLLANAAPAGMPAPIREVFELTQGHSAQAPIIAISAAMLALIAFKALVQVINALLIGWINGSIGRDIRTALSSRILNLEYSFFLRNDGSRLVQIISTDSWSVSEAVLSMLKVGPAVLGLLVFSLFLAWVDWRLFIIVLVGTVIIRGALAVVERRLQRLSIEVTQSNYALGDRMFGIVSAMRIVRVFGQQEREQARFVQLAERVRRAMFGTQRMAAVVAPSLDVLTSLLFVLVLIVGYRLGTSIPAITAFLVLLSRAQPHARTISEGRLQIAAVRGSMQEVEWLLDQTEGPPASTAGTPVDADASIRFEQVSYVYPDGKAAVRDASFEIRPGVATALIGRSGSGKTTLVNLLCGLIEPQSGSITVGGTPLAAIGGETWRERIAIAGQDIELVDGTVAENIAYGRPAASQADVEEAARCAGAAAFIATLPHGYATRVGQEGLRLSGGQRQRIGVARALLRDPDLLILDEATNAVDAISENEFIQLLAAHQHFGTALVISHHRSTLAVCQDGIVIDRGKILAAGPLRELDYYKRMAGEPEWN